MSDLAKSTASRPDETFQGLGGFEVEKGAWNARSSESGIKNVPRLGTGRGGLHESQGCSRCWQQFRLGWVEVWSPETPIQTGEVVAVIARNLGLWWLNACRIVYVVDEEEPIQRYGFAYGTLPDHAETGEERFLVERDRASGEVWYDILAFSRPHLLLTRLGYPFVRRVQKRFAKASAAAMLRAVNNVERGSNREEEP